SDRLPGGGEECRPFVIISSDFNLSRPVIKCPRNSRVGENPGNDPHPSRVSVTSALRGQRHPGNNPRTDNGEQCGQQFTALFPDPPFQIGNGEPGAQFGVWLAGVDDCADGSTRQVAPNIDVVAGDDPDPVVGCPDPGGRSERPIIPLGRSEQAGKRRGLKYAGNVVKHYYRPGGDAEDRRDLLTQFDVVIWHFGAENTAVDNAGEIGQQGFA